MQNENTLLFANIWRSIFGFLPLRTVLALYKIKTVLSGIWTQFADFITYNSYANCIESLYCSRPYIYPS